MDKIRNLPNYNTYSIELMNAVVKEDQNTINQIFNKIDEELRKIRKEKSITFERSQKMWNDPESHFKAVEAEKQADLENEITDLMSLYNIAQSANYTKGIELITNRLNKIAPNLADSLIPKNSGTVHK